MAIYFYFKIKFRNIEHFQQFKKFKRFQFIYSGVLKIIKKLSKSFVATTTAKTCPPNWELIATFLTKSNGFNIIMYVSLRS
jgi:hypothetical protein